MTTFDPITHVINQSNLRDLHGATVGVVYLGAGAAPVRAMRHVDEVAVWEISTDDAPDYVRPTFTVQYVEDGDICRLLPNDDQHPTADTTGAPSIAGCSFYRHVDGAADADLELIDSLPCVERPGLADDDVVAPPNGLATGRTLNDTDVDLTFEGPLTNVAGVVKFLPAGTPNGAKFLRDDNTWVTVPAGGGGGFSAGAVLWTAAFDITDPASLGAPDIAGVIEALNGLLTDAGLAAVVDGDKVLAWHSDTPAGTYTVGGGLTTLTFAPGAGQGDWARVASYVDGDATPLPGGTFLLTDVGALAEELPPLPWPHHHTILALQQPDIAVGSWTLTGVGTLAVSTADLDDNATVWTWAGLEMAQGTWMVDLIGPTDVDSGTIRLTLDGNDIGSIPTYSDPAAPIELTSRSFFVDADGRHDLELSNATKHDDSTGYRMRIQAIVLRRTGD